MAKGVATCRKKGESLGKGIQDDTHGLATCYIAPKDNLKSVSTGLRVGTDTRPLTLAIGVATDEIRDLHCEILARNPQCGIADKIM